MKKFWSTITKHPGAFLVGGFLLLHLLLITHYGFTWDFHFHFFGGGHLLGYQPTELEPKALPYVEPDPRRAITLPYGPLMSVPPVAAFLFFHKTLNLLPQDASYHLPIIFWGVAGIGILYLFLKQALNKHIALLAGFFLGLTPRYFGDLHNNMKDIPSSVVFALCVWLLWRLATYKRGIDLLLAAVAFAVAFNVKINSIFIPLVFGLWLIMTNFHWKKLLSAFSFKKPIIWYFIFAPTLALLLWSLFWPDPWFQLDHAYRTFGIGTNNIEVLLNGKWYCSGSTVPWYYPLWYLGVTTPIIILGFALVGTVAGLKNTKSKNLTILLLVWLFVPLTRYLLPKIGVIDGIRHFEEVLFPITALAAIGAYTIWNAKKIPPIVVKSLVILSIMWLTLINYSYHPHQITYFNELVGGVKGAYGKYDLDYWGGSQKKAVEWVNKHAPPNSRVHIVMAGDVAGKYLRPDLLTNLNKVGFDNADFVIFLNRQSFFYRFYYSYEYLLSHKPAHTISIQGAPLVWIFDNRTDNKTPRQTPWWNGEDPCILKYW